MLRLLFAFSTVRRGLASTTQPWLPSPSQCQARTTMAAAGSLVDKVYLVTGSTDGIGRHTASRLAGEGATVYVHGRGESKVAEAVEFVKGHQKGNGKVEGIVADLSSLAGMNQLCDEVLARTDRLDCLVNNAGIFNEELRHAENGLEQSFTVNALAPYVITGRLLDLVAKTPGNEGRVVNVASRVAANSIDFDNLQFEKGNYSGHASYGLSKLLNIMFNAELARKAPRGVTCVSLHPGVVGTKMLRAGWGFGGDSVTSANDEFYLATNDDVKEGSGEFYVDRRIVPSPPPAQDEEACRRLWKVFQDLSGFSYP